MCADARACSAIAFGALFLRGMPRSSSICRRQWPELARTLRERRPFLSGLVDTLRDAGQWQAALILDEPRLLAKAESLFERGEFFSIFDEAYPSRWLSVLRSGAPPAVWVCGAPPAATYVAIVGSRRLSEPEERFGEQSAVSAVRSGLSVVSGGAFGADAAAERAALAEGGAVLRVLPHGVGSAKGHEALANLSVCAPWEEFSTQNAMERNTLIYAAADRSLVLKCRLKEGGSWHGAVDALRRRSSNVFVRDDGSAPSRALASLGANLVSRPEQFLETPIETGFTRALFDLG